MTASLDVDGLLLDIDGVLVTSWQALPGAIEAVDALRAHAVPFRLITNTTTHTRAGLAETLAGAGFSFDAGEIATARDRDRLVPAGANIPGAGVFVLSDGDPGEDLGQVRLVDVDDADVVVLGGGCDGFSYDAMNRVFRRVHEGAAFVAMHRNLYWRTADGLAARRRSVRRGARGGDRRQPSRVRQALGGVLRVRARDARGAGRRGR